jgi:hypothetical protein
MRRAILFSIIAISLIADPVWGEDRVAAFLAKHCVICHGAEKAKGDFRLDTLLDEGKRNLAKDSIEKIAKRVASGEMPPAKQTQPLAEEKSAFLKLLAGQEKRTSRTVLRRLNRVEYENTIRDLFGIEIELKEQLPPDTPAHGFDNVGEALHTSSFLMERYLDAADAALNVAIANQPQPQRVQKRISLKDERGVKVATEKVFKQQDDTLIMFSSSPWNAITVGQFYPSERGRYRIRISAYGVQNQGKPVSFRIDAGPLLMGTKNHLVGYFDVPEGKPKVIEFIDHFEARNHIRLHPFGLASAQTVNKIGADQYEGPGLAVEWIEYEGPLHDSWPPESHRQLFGDLAQKPAPIFNGSKRVEVVSNDPAKDAEQLLLKFARRAFRRTVNREEIQPFLELVQKRLDGKASFESSMRVGFQAILVSPEFLFLRERPGLLDDFALASRLSYFLWSSMPDEELLKLAETKELGKPEVLRAQVERLLQHPKTSTFTEHFLGQWLSLRDIDFTSPDFRLYPEFDDLLKTSMVKETHLFFEEILKQNLSLTHFVSSDFSFLNERLARHYEIPGISGHGFQKVKLPKDSHRGGVLTMGSVLKVTSNGTTTSPVTRGAWVLDRILGTPPSPPPSGVSAVEPDIRGALNIRDQLAKHRSDSACNACHARIDPPGFALESFDVTGGYRTHYRSLGRGQPVTIDGKRMPYSKGQPVDPGDQLSDERKFKDIDELKQLLVADPDQLARALATHLLTYATGAAPQPGDRDKIDSLVTQLRQEKYGFRSLIHRIVQSELFRRK